MKDKFVCQQSQFSLMHIFKQQIKSNKLKCLLIRQEGQGSQGLITTDYSWLHTGQFHQCPMFALPALYDLLLHVSRAGAKGCWVSWTRKFFGTGLGCSLNPSILASWPAIKALNLESMGWEQGGVSHMLLIHLHTDRQTGHVTTIPNPPVPRPNLSQPPSHPR